MRILMTTDTVGGVWTFTCELARELLARGCSIALASFGRLPSTAQDNWVAQQAKTFGERFVYAASDAPLEWMSANRKTASAGEPVLLRLVESFRPELLLSSQFCFGALPAGLPKILIAHSDVLSWAECCRPEGLPRSAWLHTYCDLVRKGIDGADAVVAPTRWMLDALGRHFQLPQQTYVIPNGCSLPFARPEPLRKLQAITAGRLWDDAKHIGLLAEVESAVPIVVAGAIEDRAAQPWMKALRLIGNLQREELLRIFHRSQIYICTSIYEPFGLAPLEAALCGCAVVANDIPSLRETWRDGALYFRDANSLATLLALLRDNARFRARARRRSLLRAQRFSAHRMASRYLKLFRRVVPTRETGAYAA